VIGSGIDVIYPAENRQLAERITSHGALVSECVMGAKPDAVNFPRRNRIVSGISLGTLVVETGVDGGAMITAAMALDQNREVFAVPGPLSDKRKSGTHLLIREGKALLTECADDIVSELAHRFKGILKESTAIRRAEEPDMTLFERKLYDVLDEKPTHIDLIAERSDFSASDALVHLLSLEFKGIVRQLPGKMFMRMP
jgi:DNA processing protein